MTERWAVPAEANLPPASLRGWCSEVTPLGRRALGMCVCVCLSALNIIVCVCLLQQVYVFRSSLLCEFWWLHIQFKYSFRCVFTIEHVCSLVSHCMCASQSVFVCVCLQCNVLCFTSNPYLPLPSLCPALPQPHGDASGSGNMGRGTQGGRTPQLERNSNEPAQSHWLFPRQQAPNK